MPLKSDLLPGQATSLWQAIHKLQSNLKELRAARRLENASIGSGGVTVQDPARPESLRLATADAVGFLTGEGSGLYHPPALLFSTGRSDEVAPGEVTAYGAPGELGPIPTLLLVTPDLGHGTASVKVQAGYPGGEPPAVSVLAGGSEIVLGPDAFYALLTGGAGLALDASGAYLNGEAWAALPTSNGWTTAGGTWQAPLYHKQVDGMVQLTGSLAPGTLTAGTTIATLPVGYRPAADHEFRVPGGAATASADLRVLSSGTVTIQNTAGTITRVSLSGIRFPL